MTNSNVIQWATDRYHSYAFFANIYLNEPTLEKWLMEKNILHELAEESFDGEGANIPEDNQTVEEYIRQNYYDCLFVPMSGKYVPPYESALKRYKEGRKALFGSLNSSVTANIKKQYSLTGFDPHSLDIFPPLKDIHLSDHIGFELAYMAHLANQEKEARVDNLGAEAERWLEIQHEFLKKHLLSAMSAFAEALYDIEEGYYAKASKVVEEWLKADYEDVKEYRSKGGDCVECTN